MASKKKDEPSPRRGKAKTSEGGVAAFEQGSAAAPMVFDPEMVANELGNAHWSPQGGDTFLLQGKDGRWHPWSVQNMIDKMRALPGRMIAIKARENEMLSEAKRVLLWIRENRPLDGVIQGLAGYKSGVHRFETGESVLVKSEARIVDPEEGSWPTIRGLVEGLLDGKGVDGGIDQTQWFWSWCKVAYSSLVNGTPGNWMQGHAMILTGPPGCGKNRIQENLLSPLLGGRRANPTKYLMGEDEYNLDVMMAECLSMGEIPSSQKTADKVAFAERIKVVVANADQRARLMRADPSVLYPYWRLVISVNDDPDTLNSLPIVSSGYGDKILIFHCKTAPLPILSEPGEELAKRARFREAIHNELPAFIYWLMNEWQIPESLLGREPVTNRDYARFGFREFHHPVIRGELFEETPAMQLLRLIDLAEFDSGQAVTGKHKLWDLRTFNHDADGSQWWERAETLQQLLTGETDWRCSVDTLAKKVFQHNQCGRLLGRLAADELTGGPRGRVVKGDTRVWKGWVIRPPQPRAE